ncbi:MAG: protein kinase [Verrucomicrobiaceae bacterium]|nr:protein kinase [Verrucomicrobiaceae bacterium]
MNLKVEINRLQTGIPGLDKVLGGGLPEFSFNLLAGPPGCGKTTFAHQLMFALATSERPALYFMIGGETPLKMFRYQQQFDFFRPREIQHSIHFVNLAMEGSVDHAGEFLKRIAAAVESHKPAFVFVDSIRSILPAIATDNTSANSPQYFMEQLGMLLTSWQATTFLVGEYDSDSEGNAVVSSADGLIWLRQSVHRDSVIRKLEIVKMRGQPVLPGLHAFRINQAGIEVFPPASLSHSEFLSSTVALEETRLALGVPALDAMLGGGLPRGYSLLVAGPSGSGKTLLAAAFLSEGNRVGEGGIFVSFEPHPNRSYPAALRQLIEANRVGVVVGHSADLSIDEIVVLIKKEVERRGATRIVIDSLSSFELAVAPAFRSDFRESFSRLIGSLANLGLSVLIICELDDRFTDLRFSPYGTAFMTDAIIIQRYFERKSRLLRIISVIKVRGSAHSNELREYSIGDNGICIGEMLPDVEGILRGQARL